MTTAMKARATDPNTSKAAAKRSERFSASHANQILGLFADVPDWQLSAYEISGFTGLTVVQVDRRLNEIKQLEVVTSDGKEVSVNGFRLWKLRAE